MLGALLRGKENWGEGLRNEQGGFGGQGRPGKSQSSARLPGAITVGNGGDQECGMKQVAGQECYIAKGSGILHYR